MSAAIWSAILSALDDAGALVDAAVPAGATDVGPDALAKLRAAVHDRMDALSRALTAMAGDRDAKAMTLPLVLHLDEQVMAKLSLSDRLDWPLLQEDVLSDENGGDVFYDGLDRLLRAPAASMVHEVYAYCLDAGFRGRYDDDAPIAAYKAALAALLAPPLPKGAPGVEAPPRLPKPGLPPAVYYAGAALLVAAICVVPMLLSNV